MTSSRQICDLLREVFATLYRSASAFEAITREASLEAIMTLADCDRLMYSYIIIKQFLTNPCANLITFV